MKTTTLSIGQRVNVSVIIKEDWQSNHSLYNGIVTEILGEGWSRRVAVRTDLLSDFSGRGCYNPLAGGGLFYLLAYNIEPAI